MSLKRSCFFAFSTLTLLGCVAEQPAQPSLEKGAQAAATNSTNVVPGPYQVDGMGAGMIFARVCAETAPSFRNAPTVMADMPFRQHPETGTYFHQNFDLSIKLMPKSCSMVFTSTEDAAEIGLFVATSVAVSQPGQPAVDIDPDTGATATKGPHGTRLEFVPMGNSNGRNFYRAVLIAP